MKCSRINLGGIVATLCGGGKTPHTCACGQPSTRLCDWLLNIFHSCDARLCDSCAYAPSPGKDLCPEHRELWETHPDNPANAVQKSLPLGDLHR